MLKKGTIYTVLIILVVLLSACGGNRAVSDSTDASGSVQTGTAEEEADRGKKGDYTIDDLLGKWLCRENEQIITIGPAGTDIYSCDKTVSIMNIPTRISGDKLELTGCSTYTIREGSQGLELVCDKTEKILKGSVFIKTDDIYTDKDLFISWVDYKTGDTLIFDSKGTVTLEYKSGGSRSALIEYGVKYAGDQFYISDIGAFQIQKDEGAISLVNDQYTFVDQSKEQFAGEQEGSEDTDDATNQGTLVVKEAVKADSIEMTVEELEEKISEQPVRIVEAEVTSGSDERFDREYNSDMIIPRIINESDQPIKDANIYFVGWDDDNLPVVLKSNLTSYKSGYVSNLIFGGINLPTGEISNQDDADVYQLIPVDETCGIHKAKAIVAVYSTFDGEIWKNPYIQNWIDLYAGKPLE